MGIQKYTVEIVLSAGLVVHQAAVATAMACPVAKLGFFQTILMVSLNWFKNVPFNWQLF